VLAVAARAAVQDVVAAVGHGAALDSVAALDRRNAVGRPALVASASVRHDGYVGAGISGIGTARASNAERVPAAPRECQQERENEKTRPALDHAPTIPLQERIIDRGRAG
jgi:hypothetical protein